MSFEDAYGELIEFLDRNGARYRLLDHPPEGRTELVSLMRRNKLSEAAKCIILMVKLGKKVTRYVLAVVPGDMRVNLNAVAPLDTTRLQQSVQIFRPCNTCRTPADTLSRIPPCLSGGIGQGGSSGRTSGSSTNR